MIANERRINGFMCCCINYTDIYYNQGFKDVVKRYFFFHGIHPCMVTFVSCFEISSFNRFLLEIPVTGAVLYMQTTSTTKPWSSEYRWIQPGIE